MNQVKKVPRSKEKIVFRILLIIEIGLGIYYALWVHQWDGGMFHVTIATLLKDLAEV